MLNIGGATFFGGMATYGSIADSRVSAEQKRLAKKETDVVSGSDHNNNDNGASDSMPRNNQRKKSRRNMEEPQGLKTRSVASLDDEADNDNLNLVEERQIPKMTSLVPQLVNTSSNKDMMLTSGQNEAMNSDPKDDSVGLSTATSEQKSSSKVFHRQSSRLGGDL